MRVVATAGHVDHGKSSLVLALTGTDPDRFAEEKARGLTIDLGFAFTELPSGQVLGFVDVPGHIRFLKNMLAGVGAVEAALLVVAANEGWMPQSEEHLRILELLGVRHAVAAITKCDTVDDETVELARLELTERLDASALAGSEIVTCSARTGVGLDELRTALDALLARAPIAQDRGRPRLWIDRVFAAKGAGTVVTGTLTGGALAVDDEVVIVPGRRRARVRAIESYHERAATVAPGSRVALNLAGVEHGELHRGDAVVRPGQWIETRTIDVRLHVLPDATVERKDAYKVYAGSGEHDARVRPLTDGYARVHLATALPLAPGDRVVLRETGSQQTVGGAEVLDVAPVGRARLAPARLAMDVGSRLLGGRPWLAVADLVPLAGLDPEGGAALARELVVRGDAVLVDGDLVATPAVADVRDRAAAALAGFHERAPLEPGMELSALAGTLGRAAGQPLDISRVRAALAGCTEILVEHGRARLASHRASVRDEPAAVALVEALGAVPFAPPSPAEVGAVPQLVRALVREGVLVDLDGVVFTAAALDDARARVEAALRDRGTLTVAEARDLLGSSRKYVLAILTRLDADGVTRRRGDERVAGPRARA